MFEWLEFEENVGRFWHRWASSRSASFPSFPDAAVTLESISGPLAIFFRAGGGPAGVAIASIAARASSHRLNMRQRLGLAEEKLDLARLDEENLLLPPRIALFDDPRRNRDLYFWLAAMLAAMAPVREFKDPLRQNLSALRQVVAATQATLDGFPGLLERYQYLQRSMLQMRPARALPPFEAAMEEVICHLLGAEQPLSAEAARYYAAVSDPAMSLRDYRSPQTYRQPLPVPLWANLNHLGTCGVVENEDEDSVEPPAPAGDSLQDKRKAERRRQDQSERDDPLGINRPVHVDHFCHRENFLKTIEDRTAK